MWNQEIDSSIGQITSCHLQSTADQFVKKVKHPLLECLILCHQTLGKLIFGVEHRTAPNLPWFLFAGGPHRDWHQAPRRFLNGLPAPSSSPCLPFRCLSVIVPKDPGQMPWIISPKTQEPLEMGPCCSRQTPTIPPCLLGALCRALGWVWINPLNSCLADCFGCGQPYLLVF